MQNNTFSTLIVGQNLIKLLEVDSTNDYLKNLTSNSEPLPEGTVIMAENQFAGRGQRESVWQSEQGKNLTFSVYLKPDFLTPLNQFPLNIMVSMAVRDVLSRMVPNKVSVKWPNDIYIDDKKAGGILIENAIAGNKIKHTIIGIGINLNQVVFAEELKDKAISIAQILHEDVDKQGLLRELCNEIEVKYLQIKGGKLLALSSAYLQNLYLYKQPAKFRSNGSVFDGQIVGVSELGLLMIEDNEGRELNFGFKEVEFL